MHSKTFENYLFLSLLQSSFTPHSFTPFSLLQSWDLLLESFFVWLKSLIHYFLHVIYYISANVFRTNRQISSCLEVEIFSQNSFLAVSQCYSNHLPLFFFFFCPHPQHVEVMWSQHGILGQGLNLSHSNNQSHCNDKAGSLTCCSTKEVLHHLLFWG